MVSVAKIGKWNRLPKLAIVIGCQNWQISSVAKIGKCCRLPKLANVIGCQIWQVLSVAKIGKFWEYKSCQNWQVSSDAKFGKHCRLPKLANFEDTKVAKIGVWTYLHERFTWHTWPLTFMGRGFTSAGQESRPMFKRHVCKIHCWKIKEPASQKVKGSLYSPPTSWSRASYSPTAKCVSTVEQWRSQNRVVPRAQVGLRNVRKVSVRKFWNLGPPR